MINYLKDKLISILDTLLEPVWKRIINFSWKIQSFLVVLIICIFLLGFYPDFSKRIYHFSYAFPRVLFADDGKIPISAKNKKNILEISERLTETIKGDFFKINNGHLTPWSASQAALATAENESILKHQSTVVKYIRQNTVPGTASWTEIPTKIMDPKCIFISGWVLTAFAEMGYAASSAELEYVLESQHAEGWWSTFNVTRVDRYASTYSTAWCLIGLLSQYKKGFIQDKNKINLKLAIEKARIWLLNNRSPSAGWKLYPNLAKSKESESISGLVLHALSLAVPNQIRNIKKTWIKNLPNDIYPATENENYYLELKTKDQIAIDHFVHFKVPWILIATADAYPSCNLLEKVKALIWIEKTLKHNSILDADTNQNNWWRAEILYSLRYLLNSI